MNEHQAVFEQIVSSKETHARFLNTLACMELSGAQKLSRLVPYLGTTTFFLEHVAEEYRHAYFLRQLAQKIAGAEICSFADCEVYCATLSRGYINNLQRFICLALKSAGLAQPHRIKSRAYLLSTFAIEARSLPFYQSYQKVLDKAGIGISVRSIISEEEKHLEAIKLLLDEDPEIARFIKVSLVLEADLFARWFNQLASTLG